MSRVTILAGVLVVGLIFSGTARAAQTEHLISFQGQAADDTGEPIATGNLQVRIYNAATAGTLVYDSDQDFNNAIQDGIFDVLLGSGVELLNLDNTVKYYMEVSINGEEVVGDSRPEGRQEFWPGSGDYTHAHDDLYFTEAECNTNFVNAGEANSINSSMIAAGGVSSSDLATGAVNTDAVADGSITAADLFGTNCSEICTDANTTDCASCDSRFVNSEDLDHLDASDGSPTNAVYVDANGNVGIGTTSPFSTLSVGANGSTGAGIYSQGSQIGGQFNGSSTIGQGYGVYGIAGGGGGSEHYGGMFLGYGATTNYGVYGYGTTYGGYFTDNDSSGDDYGVYGDANGSGGRWHYGGYFSASGASSMNFGVYGIGTDYGVYGISNNVAVFGSGNNYGGYFHNSDTTGDDVGALGLANGSGGTNHYGGYFYASGATNNYGVYGQGTTCGGRFTNNDTTGNDYGVYGLANGIDGTNHYGGYFEGNGASNRNYGVYAYSLDTAVFGFAPGGTAVEGEGSYGVSGRGTVTAGSFYNSDTDGADHGVYALVNGSGGDVHTGGEFRAFGATVYNYGVRAYGSTCDFTAEAGGGTNYCDPSSIRWKRNIAEIDGALDKVANLRGVYFDWNEEFGGQHDIGMIAEEVGIVVPEVVVYEQDGVYAQAMDYSKLTPLLVQAIKEQNEIVKELKQQNDQLKELVCLDHPDAEVCEQ